MGWGAVKKNKQREGLVRRKDTKLNNVPGKEEIRRKKKTQRTPTINRGSAQPQNIVGLAGTRKLGREKVGN